MKPHRLVRAMMACAAITAGVIAPSGSVAQTLTDSLITAYQNSPILESQRAALRNIDERVALARSSMRPNINVGTSAQFQASRDTDWDVSDNYSATLGASLLLYDHGQTAAAIESAKAVVAANRGVLRNVEQSVLLNTVAAFMDVRRGVQSVTVAENNVQVLRQQVQATRDRFELGEVTRTDVSLSEARLASAQANLAAFRGQLAAAREAYRAVVGVAPGQLANPPAIPALPATLTEAEAIAVRTHPSLEAARFSQTAADFNLKRARAARGPSLTANSSLGINNTDGILGRNENAVATLSLNGNIPIYAGGQLSALVRQAEAALAQAKFDVQDTARAIRQNAAVSWSNLAVARASIVANKQQVRAARVAFEGVREEALLGARTTLDVLDLEQDLRDAEFQLASSLRDEYVAAYQLLSSMGLLSVDHLQLGIPTYDPDVNYNRVQNAPYSTVEGDILDQLRDRYSR
ncbi:TolC family outer membrane protein [Oceanibium sediminis]|uniref:TolC family outer membrane protein n=1 Tax=Oceanibium sediminis TaxID=2026339 RepID=UPI000DD38E55|nr:TolC family outer membrane protein [Oceanibium sediminis]